VLFCCVASCTSVQICCDAVSVSPNCSTEYTMDTCAVEGIEPAYTGGHDPYSDTVCVPVVSVSVTATRYATDTETGVYVATEMASPAGSANGPDSEYTTTPL